MLDTEHLYGDSQDLSAGALAWSVSPGAPRRVVAVLLHASTTITETVKVTIDSVAGANYDTLIRSVGLSAEQDFAWFPEGDVILAQDDILKVECTQANTTGVVYPTVIFERISGK